MGVSGWETGLEIIHGIQNSGGLLHQIPPSLPPCFWSRGGEEPDHNKNGFQHSLFVFYINRSGTDGMDGILWGCCWRRGGVQE